MDKESNGFLFYIMLALIALGFILSFALPAKAEMRRYQGVVCDTAEQVENWATLFRGGTDGNEALEQINTAAGNPIACAVVDVIVSSIEVEKEVVLSGEDAHILKIVVVGAMTPMGPQPLMPIVQYGAVPASASKTRI